jgi:FkbM family methyltransferase
MLSAGARVVAFEPQSENYTFLEKKFIGNKKIILCNKALSGTNNDKDFYLCDEFSQCSTLSEEFINAYSKISNLHYSKKINIECLTLNDAFLEFGMPYYIKIDAEGSDKEILSVLSSKIPIISFEYNKYLKHHAVEIVKQLASIYSFKVQLIYGNDFQFKLRTFVSANEFISRIDHFFSESILTGEIFLVEENTIPALLHQQK